MNHMFCQASAFNQEIEDWNVSSVTNMGSMFRDANSFNRNIGSWDVSGVTHMANMFFDASKFNQDIGDWNVSSLISMNHMFCEANDFNQDIGDWNVSQVTDLGSTFKSAPSFNQSLRKWNVSSVTNMTNLFKDANALSNANKGEIHKTFSMNSNWPHPSWSAHAVYTPITDSNFQTAVNLWFSDEANATVTYGHISDWNTSAVTDMSQAFKNRSDFNENISEWDTSNVWTMSQMFLNASSFNKNIGNWDISTVRQMAHMFNGAESFNQDIGDWNTSDLNYAPYMFVRARSFNQDVSKWNMSKVTAFNNFFYQADNFNQDLGNWDTSSATNMGNIFNGAISFNQDISDWNISGVNGMTNMFKNTPVLSNANKGKIHTSFSSNQNWSYDWRQYVIIEDSNFQTAVNLWFSNQADANKTYGHIRDWNTSAVTDMSEAFKDRTIFNENISGWDVSNVTSMKAMFSGASSFDQPIGNWNVSSVRNLQGAFKEASAFNQAIGDWNVSSADTMQGAFLKASAFNQPIGNWNVSSVTSLRGAFNGASSFNQNIGDWNISSATNMQSVFNGASAFDQDLSDWNVSSATVMTDMFKNTTALSSSNKERIHASFSSNPNWPYDWSDQGAQPHPDDNATQPGAPAAGLFQPIVETRTAKNGSGTSATLRGKLVDNGGSPVTERGFLLSAKPNPKPDRPNVQRILDVNGSRNFQAQATNLKAGKKYFYRAFATNAEGTSLGSVETFVTPAGPPSPSWINAQPGTADNWWTSRWFGNFYLNANGWARHEKLGWVFPMESPTAGLWLWKEGMGWLWTDKGIYPFIYDNKGGGWLYFYGQNEGTKLFYDYVRKKWTTLKEY